MTVNVSSSSGSLSSRISRFKSTRLSPEASRRVPEDGYTSRLGSVTPAVCKRHIIMMVVEVCFSRALRISNLSIPFIRFYYTTCLSKGTSNVMVPA